MTVLYQNLCYNEVCYEGTALYLLVIEELVVILIGETTFLDTKWGLEFEACSGLRLSEGLYSLLAIPVGKLSVTDESISALTTV